MPKYTLHYFDGRGRGEGIRLLFKIAGKEFEDKRYTFSDWPEYKPKTPFGQLPVLTVDDVVIAQTHAIGRYLAREFNLYGSNSLEAAIVDQVVENNSDLITPSIPWLFGEKDEATKAELKASYFETIGVQLNHLGKFLGDKDYFLGDKISYADVVFFTGLEFIILKGEGTPEMLKALEEVPNLKKLYDRVASYPAVAEWIKVRPQNSF
ncbi:DgyrCDS3972 [Dimorphilus gyrociliatus]|uniref:glutathione transferase n=1 Tax=Dimorphilus gyrociliatus TaxID=2664684 RepID=A0A7I8VK32_9ANNE|nr:DgyrCDS3972 [Dimorphilus gyrociliatus]